MSLQQLYETVIREEEYIMDQRKTFAEELRSEFLRSGTEYCLYCMEPKGDKHHCCGENHFATFVDMPEEDQEWLIEQEIDMYDEWSRK